MMTKFVTCQEIIIICYYQIQWVSRWHYGIYKFTYLLDCILSYCVFLLVCYC